MPALGNFTFHGFGGPSSARPDETTLEPLMTLPPWGESAGMFGTMLGWPLNQRSAPAASLAPVTGWPTGIAKEGRSSPLGTKITSPKPVAHLK